MKDVGALAAALKKRRLEFEASAVERFLQRNSILFPHATSVCVLLFLFDLWFEKPNQHKTQTPTHTHTHFLIPVKFPFKGRVGRDSSVF